MSSMDQVHEHMRELLRQLNQFHSALDRSMATLESRHNAADPLWKDSFRKEYDGQWGPLEQAMKVYRQRTAQQYARFLEAKLRALEQYLGIHRG